MENTTILLVEDNRDDEFLTLWALEKGNVGNKVYVVRDGVEALDFPLLYKYICRIVIPCDLPSEWSG